MLMEEILHQLISSLSWLPGGWGSIGNFGEILLMVQKSQTTTWDTLPETNIEPENGSSQKESSIPPINFQVLC